MPAARRLPDGEILVAMAADMSNKDIATRFGVSAEAVRQKLAAAGFRREPERPDHSYYIPWRIRADHASDVIMRRLRAYSKREQGRPLSDTERRLLDEWLQFMDGDNPTGLPLSVHYAYNDDEGFWLEPRQPGDRNYIRPPEADVLLRA